MNPERLEENEQNFTNEQCLRHLLRTINQAVLFVENHFTGKKIMTIPL